MRNAFKILIVAMFTANFAAASYVAPPQPITKGGTGSTSQSANKAVTTDASSHIVSVSATTDTEIGYLSGVSSAIQTQINGKANTALSNIASVALSADLICATTGSCKLGSAAKPFGDSFLNLVKDASSVVSADFLNRVLKNSSGNAILTYSGSSAQVPILELLGSTSGHIDIQSSATPTNHAITLPDTVCSSGQYWSDNGSGVMSCTSLTIPNPTSVDGGDAAYSILSANAHVRSGTTLTAARTYSLDACTAGNIGERHSIKNLPSQGFVIHVGVAGSDLIDGASTYDLSPGDSVSVICAAFSSVGTWDIE